MAVRTPELVHSCCRGAVGPGSREPTGVIELKMIREAELELEQGPFQLELGKKSRPCGGTSELQPGRGNRRRPSCCQVGEAGGVRLVTESP